MMKNHIVVALDTRDETEEAPSKDQRSEKLL
jgi:hypothetical protein